MDAVEAFDDVVGASGLLVVFLDGEIWFGESSLIPRVPIFLSHPDFFALAAFLEIVHDERVHLVLVLDKIVFVLVNLGLVLVSLGLVLG